MTRTCRAQAVVVSKGLVGRGTLPRCRVQLSRGRRVFHVMTNDHRRGERFSWTRLVRVLVVTASVVSVLVVVPACEDRNKLLESYSAQAKTSRVTVTSGLVASFKAGQVTADEAITLAASKLEVGEDAVDFAWAVLDMLKAVETQLPSSGEFEIFWRRVGRLAFWAAQTAYTKGRLSDSASLMEAGPDRWKNEAYWLRYTDHDALVAIILDATGQKSKAIQRLGSRAELLGAAEEVYKKLTERR